MRVYNTLTKSKEEFVPREAGKVSMYVCGPTVYNHIHIGNARSFLSFDVIRRYLEYKGYDVNFVQNITDVDDKIINRAKEEGRTAAEVAEEYTAAFISAMHALGIKDPTVRPSATETIPEMIALIERLIAGGHAYESGGDVYFAVRSFPSYGKLSGRDIDEMENQARIDHDDRKRDPLDFALWKSAKPDEPHWASPWGEGRPGWHIECSAMSEMELGLPFDIHGGGTRPGLPAPRERDRAVRSRDRRAVRELLAAWRHAADQLREDEQVAGQLQARHRRARRLRRAGHPPADAPDPLPQPARLLRHAPRGDDARLRASRESRAQPALGARPRCMRHGRARRCDRRAEGRQCRRSREVRREMDDDFNTAGALGAIFELARAANRFLAEYQTDLCEEDRIVLVRLRGDRGVAPQGPRHRDRRRPDMLFPARGRRPGRQRRRLQG